MNRTFGVVGMGYVGLTLTAALARAGHTVHGVDAQHSVVETLSQGRPHIYEPGLAEVFAELVGTRIHVGDQLPHDGLDAVLICVSTPVDEATQVPNLANVAAAARDIARWCSPETLVVVRSTVPIGTTRSIVLPALLDEWPDARLAMAPERTIQGQALRELVELPQVVGGLDEASLQACLDVFDGFVRELVPMSSLEAAEMVKLANNCHTDLIYAYGNELALVAQGHGLDPLEVIRAANLHYPRPDLARPGYVGGGCLTKDPYIMVDSAQGREPFLVPAARALNEHMPRHVAATVIEMLEDLRGGAAGARLSVLGWAYKGVPATDDMRGTPITTMMPVFAEAGITVLGHDPVVTDEVIRAHGGDPVSLDKALGESDAVLVLNDHPDYQGLPVDEVWNGQRPLFVFDSWRVLDEAAVLAAGVRYAGLGYLAGAGATS